jgi:hypothetical protein
MVHEVADAMLGRALQEAHRYMNNEFGALGVKLMDECGDTRALAYAKIESERIARHAIGLVLEVVAGTKDLDGHLKLWVEPMMVNSDLKMALNFEALTDEGLTVVHVMGIRPGRTGAQA